MDEDAFPSLFAETYLLPPESRPVVWPARRLARASQRELEHTLAHLNRDVPRDRAYS